MTSPPIYFPKRHDLPEPNTKAFEDFQKTLLDQEKANRAEKASDFKNAKRERQELFKNQEGSLLELAAIRAFENVFKADYKDSNSQNVTLLWVQLKFC